MRNKNFITTAKSYQLVMASLCLALALVLPLKATQFGSDALSAGDAGTQARAELARIPTDRIARVKDTRQREALQRVVTALQAVANNKSQDRVVPLLNEVDRSMDNLMAAPNPTKGSHECFSSVGSDFKSCQTSCKGKGKKFCGCLAAAILDTLKCIV